MHNYIFPILSVSIGFLIVILFKPSNQKNLKLLLAFSGAFLLAITVFNLLPEVFEDHMYAKQTGIWIMGGILLQIFLEYFSKGAEHGHVHLSKDRTKLPWVLFSSLGIHALLEGFPLHHTENGLLIGIIIHKVPVAMILTTFLLQTKISKYKSLFFLMLFAFMTPLGSFIAETFTGIQAYYKQITALVIGIFLHISTTILFESNEGHSFNLTKLLVILIAIITAYLI
ncbi:ZIP family metal transporter [Aquimarina rhabdastrellae]